MARRVKQEVIGVCSVLGSIYVAISLVSYEKWDPSPFTFSTEPAGNYGGIIGSYLSDILVTAIGIASFAIPVFGVVYGLRRMFGKEGHRLHFAGSVLFVLSVSVLTGLMGLSFRLEHGGGGFVGSAAGRLLHGGLSTVGAYIVALALVFTSLIMLSPVSIINLIAGPFMKKKSADRKKKEPPEARRRLIEDYVEPIVVEPPYIEEHDVADEPQRASMAEGYKLPQLDLLNLYDPVERQTKEDLLENLTLLEQKLLDFSVEGKVTQVHTGPIVTMFEFEPAPGVKINRVVSLADDLALSLRARSVRIAPLAGKASIGVEIPNRNRETVSLREILASEGFRRSPSKLTIALGKDIFGTSVAADLSRMPHLLVAGSTGSGKSVSLNTMVLSILYKATPDEVKFLMIDPKLLELSSYNGIPHLISPVLTNPKEAADMLRKMVYEMERRYRLIAQKGARNIDTFNAAAEPEERLPYIVIFIDELADLMFAAASNVEDSIARLAQMARASGIHLVLATQRPSVDVITGVIKANFPARIAFHVTSKIDSRTIIDAQGAEQLLGKGDLLFMMPGKAIKRVHGALVTEGEVRAVAEFISAQGNPDFSMMQKIDSEMAVKEAEASAEEDRDEMYGKVLDYAQAVGEVSISSIQRRFKIGYNRAARIMEILEEDGRVGPPRGAGKPRDFIG